MQVQRQINVVSPKDILLDTKVSTVHQDIDWVAPILTLNGSHTCRVVEHVVNILFIKAYYLKLDTTCPIAVGTRWCKSILYPNQEERERSLTFCYICSILLGS